ncbi:MAG: isoprenylcysteine carboxylmethyltransferase family protein [Saprospiraceae bacterium]|nr:isoprenylcysteine carboxylmethyltransferase family protein [Saprospiraceae bacterium]
MLLLVVTLCVYYGLHSFLAASSIKKHLIQSQWLKKYYRIIYNSIAVVGLLLVFYVYTLTEREAIWQTTIWTKILGLGGSFSGIWVIYQAMKGYAVREFLGLNEVSVDNSKEVSLQTVGFNSYVRHPLYFGTLLLVAGAFILFPNTGTLAVAVLTVLYLLIGIQLEEKKLIQEYGQAYLDYQKQVPMLLPTGRKKKHVL